MSYANRYNFASSFMVLMLFISFSCLIVLIRISSIVFNISGETKHLVFFLILREGQFFIIVYEYSNGLFIYNLCYVEMHFFYSRF